ncbi:MAG: hypothetical protein LUD27_03055 [Clostridia bacterium]|nr:hypothetical protein [Clostridia bacterium]
MRKIIYDNLHKIIALLCAVVICIAVVFGCTVGTTAAYAESFTSAGYSDVLTDLQTDENFNTDDYPADNEDYSLSVIQVAESTDGELLIYVYQPSFAAMPLTATQISMSLYEWNSNDTSYNIYDITLVSQKGVFQKYRVDNFIVSSDSTRYYDIATIYREFNAEIDEETDDDNTVNGVGFEVGKCWTVKTDIGGNVTYSMQETQVVIITDMHLGFIRYENDFNSWDFTSSYVDSHYVAFSTDWDIDTLFEIDISFYTVHNVYSYVNQSGEATEFDISIPDYTYYDDPLTLTYEDTLSIDVSGKLWFHKEYTWDRLQTVSGFLSDNEDTLTDETKSAISNMQYVVRFYESEYEYQTATTTGYASVYKDSTDVEKVRILRLKFEADGDTYNLGAVSNVQTGDSTPDGEDDYNWEDIKEDFLTWWDSLKSSITTVLKIVFGVIFGILAVWLLSWVVKLIKMLVSSVKRLFKKDKDKDKKE